MATNTMMSRRTGARNERDANNNHNKNSQMERRTEEVFAAHDKTETAKGQSAKEKTMSEHIETRKKIQRIADVQTFQQLLDQSTLSDIDKSILSLHYLQDKDFRFIGDTLGFSESTIKKRHRKILSKLSRLL